MSFTHLHVHSHLSLLEAVPQIPHLVAFAKKNNFTSLALTDTNNLYGAIDFQKECKRAGIKSIIGVEISVAEKSMLEEISNTNRIFKLVLLAKNLDGYKKLVHIVSDAHITPKGKLRLCVDMEYLKNNCADLFVLSGLTESYLTEKMRTQDFQAAEIYLNFCKDNFGNNFYIEIDKYDQNLIDIAKKTNIPLVATYNVHYLHTSDRPAQKVLMGISPEIEAREKYKNLFQNSYFNFRIESEALKDFENLNVAIENTDKIAKECNVQIPLGDWVFPKITVPDGFSPGEYLRKIVYDGFETRKLEKNEVTLARVDYELDIIIYKGFDSYLLCVADLLRAAKEKKILTNIRGSVSGSLVTYLAGITNIDPLEFEIPFERFLYKERPGAPDIDMDYADNRREEMIDYVKEKYGQDKIAQIITFGTMAARAAARDVARSMGYPYLVGDRISKMIPMGSQGFPMTLERALLEEPEFKKDYDDSRETKEIIDMAMKIEGNARHVGVHAAGVLISPTDLQNFTPIQYDPKGEGKIISQYDMYSIEDAGLLKFDFLGLGNLRIIAEAINLIEINYGVQLDYDTIDMKDKKTFEMLTRGETTDTFQLNGTGMTKFLMELAPTSVNDINAMVALYRPGPLQFIPEYIRRKNNPEIITYLDEALRPILEKTYGILVYQDDLLMMANKIAGYSWTELDKFRKAVGKKIPAEMAEQKEKFIKGCVTYSKWQERKAKELWTWIEPFAAYGFNKAHSVSYGRVAYVTAYLKANYPTEYMTAVLRSEEGETEKVAISVRECLRIGIKILPPNVNYSESHFSIIKKDEKHSVDAIVFGLNTIKNLSTNSVEEIVLDRQNNGKFKTLSEFLKRISMKSMNKKSIEALINSGALDDLGERVEMFGNVENILEFQRQIHDTHKNEVSLFDDVAEEADLKLKPTERKDMRVERRERLYWERELLGLYLTGHPLDPWKEILKMRKTNIKNINTEAKNETMVEFPAIISTVKTMLTKKKDKMAFLQVEDLEDNIEIVMFPKTYALFSNKIVHDKPFIFKGRVSYKNKDEVKDKEELTKENLEKKVRDDGTEAKSYGTKSIILEEIREM